MVALIMLVIFTLLAVSGITATNSGLRIAGNSQLQGEVNAAAELAIEQVINQVANFQYASAAAPPAQTVTVPVGGVQYTASVTLRCLGTAPVPGYSASFSGSAPNDSYWDVQAAVTDPRSGATTTVHQGMRVILMPGQVCPN